jgi:hypothetical protein
VNSRKTKRREAWQLIAWVGAVIAGLLILYYLSEGTPPFGTGAMAPFFAPCWIGYLLAVGVGIPITYGWSKLLFWLLERYVRPTVTEVEAGQVVASERIPWMAVLVGIFERALITTLVAYDISGGGSFIAAWVAMKMAIGWQRWGQGTRYARAAAFMALLGNAMSILLGLVGGILRKAAAILPTRG